MTVVGTRKVQQKLNGTKLTGTATIYYGTPLFLDMALEYINKGTMPYFDIQITNSDPTTTVSSQIVACYGCKLSGTIPMSILDSDTNMLTMEISFTYSSVEKMEGFSDPSVLGN